MCGILGVWNKKSNPKINEMLLAQTPLLCNLHDKRGPDQVSLESVGDFLLVFNRLKIVGDDVHGLQPIHTKDSILLFNGEIYNYKEFDENATSDSLLLASLRSESVLNFPYDQIRGQFAICDINIMKDEVVLSRDYFGEKPLYFYEDNDILIFSSTSLGIRSIFQLLHMTIAIDDSQVPTFLATGFQSDGTTLFKNIMQVKKGHQIRFFRNAPNQEIKWSSSIVLHQEYKSKPIQKLAAEFFEIFKEVVREQTDGVKNPAITFSGGVDSTILAIAAKEVGARVNAFTIGFDSEEFDESEHAKQTADQLGIPLNTHIMSGKDALTEFQEIIKCGMDPLGDPSSLPTRYLSSQVAQYTKVALGGDGSDELFFGYHRMHQLMAMREDKLGINLDKVFLKKIYNLYRYKKLDQNQIYLNMLGQPRFATELTGISEKSISEKMCREIGKLDGKSSSLRDFEINGYLTSNILIKGDRSSMEYSLELRNPFLDLRILKFAYSNNVLLGSSEKNNKHFLRDFMKDYVTEDNYSRAKRGFTPPLGRWLRNELYPDSLSLLESANFSALGLSKSNVLSLFDDFISEKRDIPIFTVWAILMLALQIQN